MPITTVTIIASTISSEERKSNRIREGGDTAIEIHRLIRRQIDPSCSKLSHLPRVTWRAHATDRRLPRTRIDASFPSCSIAIQIRACSSRDPFLRQRKKESESMDSSKLMNREIRGYLRAQVPGPSTYFSQASLIVRENKS